MYAKSDAYNLKREFWTSFGQYMKPIANAEGLKINWVNYKTGIRHIYFRMDANKRNATIAIELKHPLAQERSQTFAQLETFKNYFEKAMGANWYWQPLYYDEDGGSAARVFAQLDNVSIFKKEDWPAIITFLKAGITNLDVFWSSVKAHFEI